MSQSETIWIAAKEALVSLGGEASVDEILAEIEAKSLYTFGTDEAAHVLETELKRRAVDTPRSDGRDQAEFEHVSAKTYRILSKTMTQKSKATGSKRIHRAKDKEEIIALLTSDRVGVFREIWRLLLFAAQLGIRKGRRDKLAEVDSGKGIDQQTFGNSPSWPGVLYLAALVEQNSSNALAGTTKAEDERLTIFQEYANGGLAILQDYFEERNASLEDLLSFLSDESTKALPDVDVSDLGIL